MALQSIEGGAGRVSQSAAGAAYIAAALGAWPAGGSDVLFGLGVAYSTGSHGVASDMIEAHRWFNIAAALGHEEAAGCRADVSDEMTAREIVEAQRRARAWLAQSRRRAA